LETDTISNLIAENYIQFPNKDGKMNKDADFSTAVQVASNKVLSKASTLDKSTDAYIKAMQDIQSGDHKREYK
jgi:hypothetical protein